MSFAALFLALAATCPASYGELLHLRSVYGAADPLSFALAPAEDRLFVAEGAGIVELELPSLRELSRTAIDAGILDMTCTPERLWIAGGSQGLWSLDRATRMAECVDAPTGLACLSVAAHGARIYAGFGAAAGPELRVYEATTGARSTTLALPGGTPHALALSDGRAFVALGDAGVCAVEWDESGLATIRRGPSLSELPWPAGFRLTPGHARDLARDGERLYVAADAAGLLVIDISRGLRPDSELWPIPLPQTGAPFYAARVDARGGRIALGVNRGSTRLVDGAPWSSTGTMGWDLNMGGESAQGLPEGAFGATFLFRRAGEGYELAGSVRHPLSAWRDIALGRAHVYELHMRLSLLVRPFAQPEQVLATRRARGFPAISGVTSPVDPELLFFGMDSQGALARGLLRIEAGERLALVPGTLEQRSLGLAPGAAWLDERPEVAWVLGDRGLSWALHRIDHGAPPRVTSWSLPHLVGPDGGRASSYFFARLDGDRLLLTCAGLRHGLMVHSAAELVAAARRSEPESELSVAPRALVATHGPEESPPYLTWGAAPFRTADGRALAAVAAGSYGGELDGVAHPARVVIVELEGEGTPRVIGAAHGPRAHGQAIAIEVARLAGRPLAFVGDLGGRLSLFDLSQPESPRHLLDWISPPNPFDGQPDVVLDVALRLEAGGLAARLFLAAGRRGVVALRVHADPLRIEALGAVDTPGWAAGLYLQERAGGDRLLVGDQKGGLRLYALPEVQSGDALGPGDGGPAPPAGREPGGAAGGEACDD